MTANHWQIVLIITSFIAQLIAPSIAAFVASRSNQPKPTPQPNQPKNRIQRIGGWLIHFVASPWILPPFGILCDIGVLVWLLRSSAPVTRGVVVAIASAIVGIVWNVLNMDVLLMTENQHHLIDTVSSQINILSNQEKRIGQIIERIDKIERGVPAHQKIRPKKTN